LRQEIGIKPEAQMTETTGVAIVGCGYIADSYRHCLRLHGSELRLVGFFDRDLERLRAHGAYWGGSPYQSIEDLLGDATVEIVVNLTDPENHAAVTRAALQAGKHVYSEKPLALTRAEAVELRDLASAKGLRMAAAPCNILGESAQTLWQAVRSGAIGATRLVYAELDDGMIHKVDYRNWINRSGKAWPARGEFKTGCTFEHAGYVLTVLCAMFGPARRVTSFSSILIADKQTEPPLPHPAPDFSVGIVEFDGGLVARITNSIVAPYDHRLRVIGDNGSLEVREAWDYSCPVKLRSISQGRISRYLERRLGGLGAAKTLSMARHPAMRPKRGDPTMDFARGVAELAAALRQNRPARLDADFAVHIAEVTEILQHPERFARPAPVHSFFPPIAPMDWAK
jgi:predicted dehydrogenase